MKIDRNIEAERVAAVQATRESTASQAADEAGPPAAAAPLVDLSGQAKTVQKLRDAVDQSPSIRSDKVEKLRKQVQDGTLNIDTSKLADVMERFLGNA